MLLNSDMALPFKMTKREPLLSRYVSPNLISTGTEELLEAALCSWQAALYSTILAKVMQ